MVALLGATAVHPCLGASLRQSQVTPPALDLAGRVVRVRGDDSAAVARAWVVLHRIGRTAQGPLDSQPADANGRFRFREPRPEAGAVYTVSTRYSGIGYFSEPVAAEAGAAAPVLKLAVYDTASAGAPLTIGLRHVIVSRPGSAGGRRVLDIIEVRNATGVTRVGADAASTVFAFAIPRDIAGPEVGQSDVPPEAVRFLDGRVEVAAPLAPGSRQVAIGYQLPPGARALVLPADQAMARLELIIEDSSVTAPPGFNESEPVEIEGRTFRRFGRDSVLAGDTFRFALGGGSAERLRSLWWLPVAAAFAALAAGGVLAVRVARR